MDNRRMMVIFGRVRSLHFHEVGFAAVEVVKGVVISETLSKLWVFFPAIE